MWSRIHKGDIRGRLLADRHYSRQSVGHPMWTRPGFNHVLYATFPKGEAVFCWWRPKWESGIFRKDRLVVLECTMFRREGITPKSSGLISDAVSCLQTNAAVQDLRLYQCGPVDHLITGVMATATRKCRSKKYRAGICFWHAGWRYFDKQTRRADTWLYLPWHNTAAMAEEKV